MKKYLLVLLLFTISSCSPIILTNPFYYRDKEIQSFSIISTSRLTVLNQKFQLFPIIMAEDLDTSRQRVYILLSDWSASMGYYNFDFKIDYVLIYNFIEISPNEIDNFNSFIDEIQKLKDNKKNKKEALFKYYNCFGNKIIDKRDSTIGEKVPILEILYADYPKDNYLFLSIFYLNGVTKRYEVSMGDLQNLKKDLEYAKNLIVK